MKVAVVGAGIGGLTAALCLLREGFEVEVFEQAPELRPVGAGIQLSANATRVLFRLGLDRALMEAAAEPRGKFIRLWNTGEEWTLFDLGAESVKAYGHPYLMLYRPDLVAVLAGALPPGVLCLRRRISDPSDLRADVVIGADGVHSEIRKHVAGEDRPQFSGCIAWRGVVPVERLPATMQRPAGFNWVGPGAHVIHYPVHAGRLVNFTGIVEKQGWFRESWTEAGTTAECLADFAGWHEDVRALVRQIERPMKWAMMVREPLAAWTRGHVALLGDAAHPMLPFLAQGAAMAIEDGCVLARCLAQFGRGGLAAYEATRKERATKVTVASAANTRRFHNPELADARGAARYVAREWEEGRVRERYEWLFRYEAERIPLQRGATT